jgi:hypothetical protein
MARISVIEAEVLSALSDAHADKALENISMSVKHAGI